MSVYYCMVNMTLSEKYARHHPTNNNAARYENVRAFKKAIDHHIRNIQQVKCVIVASAKYSFK